MPFGEPRGRQKCWKKIIGTAAFVRTEITLRHSSAQCVMLEKVNDNILFPLDM